MTTGRRGRDAGFALIEAVVALAIGGAVLLGARMLLEQLADGTDRLVDHAATVDREANADRLLRALVGRVEAASVVRGAVRGDRDRLRLATWCYVPAGWLERCTAVFAFVPVGDGTMLTLSVDGGAPVELRRGFRSAGFLYLRDPRAGGSWLDAWPSRVTTPLAIGLVVDGDTAILRIGERG